MSKTEPKVKCSVRLMLGEEIAIGPGKVQLLAAIRDCGSISGAARQMGMSYRRAWLLVETMNQCFANPLVETATGGKAGGGARLSSDGEIVLQHYEVLLKDVESIAGKHMEKILRKVRLAI